MLSGTVAVYVGKGSSHSWTWLADLFESKGLTKVRFADNQQFLSLLRGGTSCAIISGGDGFEIARSLGEEGFRQLRDYVEGGGRYVGMCAGAYLPLPSRVEPFSKFNLSTTKVENLDRAAEKWDNASPRLAVQYGQCAIFHPVRGEVQLSFTDGAVVAPIFGGPVFKEPSEDEVISRYAAFTEGTQFQVDRARAETTVIGKPAVIRSRVGSGEMLLFGPHLEHPRYPEANRRFLSLVGLSGTGMSRGGPKCPSGQDPLARAVADLKVSALGLENRSFLIGEKLWDAGRVLELVSAIEKRTALLSDTQKSILAGKIARVREGLRRSSGRAILGSDAAPSKLVELAREVTDRHFAALRALR